MPETRSRPRRRERRTVARGKAFIQSTFKQHAHYNHRYEREHPLLGKLRIGGLQRVPQRHTVCRPGCGGNRSAQGGRLWHGASGSLPKGTGVWSGVCDPIAPSGWIAGNEHYRRNTHSAQRPTSAPAQARVVTTGVLRRGYGAICWPRVSAVPPGRAKAVPKRRQMLHTKVPD